MIKGNDDWRQCCQSTVYCATPVLIDWLIDRLVMSEGDDVEAAKSKCILQSNAGYNNNNKNNVLV